MRCTFPLVTLVSVVIACSPDQIPTDPPADVTPAAPAAATAAFRQVSTGTAHTCAVAGDDRAYCWGYNNLGELGDGTLEPRTRPVAVAGGFRFRMISAGNGSTCGITTDDLAYCWGNIGSPAPTPVPGGLRWRTIDAGLDYACQLRGHRGGGAVLLGRELRGAARGRNAAGPGGAYAYNGPLNGFCRPEQSEGDYARYGPLRCVRVTPPRGPVTGDVRPAV